MEHWAIVVALAMLAICLVIVAFARRENETLAETEAKQAGLWTLVTLFFVSAIFVIGSIWLWDVAGDDKRPDLIAILLTGLTATMAVIVQMRGENNKQRSERLSIRAEQKMEERRQRLNFTHERIQEFRTDREVQLHKANLRRFYPADYHIPYDHVPLLFAKSIDPLSLNADGAEALHAPVWTSINDLLSFYEQLAADVFRQAVANGEENPDNALDQKTRDHPGSVDEELLHDVLSGAMIATFKTTLAVIEAHWRDDHEVFERIRWLVNRWQFPLPENERDIKHAVDPETWSSKTWTEYGEKEISGVKYPLIHGSDENVSWNEEAYGNLALKGLEAWPKASPAKELKSKLLKMYPAHVSQIETLTPGLTETTAEPHKIVYPSKDAQTVAKALNGVTAAISTLKD